MQKQNKDSSPKSTSYSFDIKADVKKSFENKYKPILQDKYDEFIKYSLTFPRKSIRLNTIKKPLEYIKEKLEKNFELTKIPWSRTGYWIKGKILNKDNKERRDIGNTIEHSLGYIYIQEASSMVPVEALGEDLVKDGIIFDMCAAPGSKTTQLAQNMNNKGLIIANEMDYKRIAALGQNIIRCGLTNAIITQHNAMNLQKWIDANIQFDNIILDAPCSGTGTIRKSPYIFLEWNPRLCIAMARVQRKLIDNAFLLLKKGGVMIYSTCSIEPEENEEVVDYLMKKYDNIEIMDIKLDINRSEPILNHDGKTYNKEIAKTLRIWPQDNDTDGFYVAKICKL